ncbi:MAG: D-hexose-6-phosphate mutarotase [Saprospiraceae bacterium]|nr:D-hexose-6-phosphate mutarotase [Saprospiraceae bacterium]MBK8851353.1 D-hexose-6-phosphate mutarotase [Saprospiraceae bacterium]
MTSSCLSYTTKGGQVLGWQAKDHVEPVLFCSALADINGAKAIRGGIPVCWPWFGPREGASQHGIVRTEKWSLLRDETLNDTHNVHMELSSQNLPSSIWPYHWNLSMLISAATSIKMQLTTLNEGNETFFITQALHTNFLVGNIHDTQLSGLDGKSYMDKTQQNEKRTQQGLLTIDNEIDRIYLDTQQVLIHDHANQRVIKVKSNEASAMVVWNPWEEKCSVMADLQNEDYKKFICVEAANFPEPIGIEPGQSFTLDMEISVDVEG